MTKEKPTASHHSLRFMLHAAPHSHWWRMTGSNRRPPACKAGALPAELIPLPLAFDKRRIAALLHRLHNFRYAARSRALRCLLLKAHRLCSGLIHHPVAATLVCENQARQGGALRRLRFVGKRCDNAVLRRLSQTNGGSGWVRTIDPRLIKTVL